MSGHLPDARKVWLDSLMVWMLDSVITKSWVQLPGSPLAGNNPGQVVNTTQPVDAMLFCWPLLPLIRYIFMWALIPAVV